MIYQILHQKLKTEQHNTHKLPLELEYWLPLFWTWTWDVFFLLGIGLEKHIDAAVVISGVEEGTYMKHLASKMSSLLIHSNSENTFNSCLLSFERWDNCIKKNGILRITRTVYLCGVIYYSFVGFWCFV
jgi:hypothetical protein